VLNNSSALSESIAIGSDTKPISLDVPGDFQDDPCQMADSESIPVLQLDGSLIAESEGAASMDLFTTYPSASTEPRLIVEALVVRKMSSEEAFLDFSGFSLT
jgi:hypothetical protein